MKLELTTERFPYQHDIYLAGPMTGYPKSNFPAFIDMATRLRDVGYTVWSPAEKDIENGYDPLKGLGEVWTLREYMFDDLHAVLNARMVAVLPGWEKSRGANLEVFTALSVGTPVYVAEDLANGFKTLVDVTYEKTYTYTNEEEMITC
jgi:hypothetical protein